MIQLTDLIAEGKTKRVWRVEGHPTLVVIHNKDDITKNDDPSQTRQMESKARIATETTCIVFEILKREGIPVAYQKQISPTEFLATNCQMIPAEIIERRYGVGSFLLRHPDMKEPEGIPPKRFDEPLFEVFAKTAAGRLVSKNGREIGMLPVNPKTGRRIDDPLVANPDEDIWLLRNSKVPATDGHANIFWISRGDILPMEDGVAIEKIRAISNRTFLILEKVFERLGSRLIDFKIEFGKGPDGELLIADVIDNDSWRLMTHDWKELSKELFRQNHDLSEVKESYEFVLARLKQALPR